MSSNHPPSTDAGSDASASGAQALPNAARNKPVATNTAATNSRAKFPAVGCLAIAMSRYTPLWRWPCTGTLCQQLVPVVIFMNHTETFR